MAPALDTLTEAQAAVYDRQLRVWGVEVQRRLMEAKVLVIGLGGLAAEVAKNLVLAGVGTLALRDDSPAAGGGPEDGGGNFLVDAAAAAEGRSAAEASARTLQAMNPLIAVRTEPGPPTVAPLVAPQGGEGAEAQAVAELVSRYDVVLATGLPLAQVAALDELCRARGVALFAAEASGASAWAFADCGPRHTYTLKGEAAERVLSYPTFAAALSADLAAVTKRTHPLYLALRACWEVEAAQGRPAAGAGDVAAAVAAGQRLLAATPVAQAPAVAAGLLPRGLLEGFVLDRGASVAGGRAGAGREGAGEEEAEGGGGGGGGGALGPLAPVCAVVGGVLANSVMRAISRVNPPLHNLFCYSLAARDGAGFEERFP